MPADKNLYLRSAADKPDTAYNLRLRSDADKIPTGGWANIAKVNGVTAAAMAKLQGVAVAAIGKVSGVAV